MKNSSAAKPHDNASGATRIIGFLLILLLGHAHAAPGDLDTTFGTAGKVFIDIDTASADLAWTIVRDGAGNIYLGGQSSKTSVDSAVIKLNANGKPDTSFGSGGKVSW